MDAIELVIDPRKRPVGNGVVRRVLPWRRRRMVGPFIFADLIGPDELAPGASVDVDAHPHIGLSTLTYLFEGRMVHRDSTGVVQTIEARAVNWMTAGSGVCHTERSHPDDVDIARRAHGLQCWVALPADAEEVDPSFAHVDAADAPSHGAVRLVAGTGWAMTATVPVSSPLVLAEVALDDRREGGGVDLDGTHPERAVLALEGDVRVNDRSLESGQLAVIERGASARIDGRGRAIVLGGEPVGERFIWWNFVHSDRDRIEQAKADWTAQRFPTVPGDHDPWVPLPA